MLLLLLVEVLAVVVPEVDLLVVEELAAAVEDGMKSTIVIVCARRACGAGALNVLFVDVEHWYLLLLSQHIHELLETSYWRPVRYKPLQPC